MTIDPALQASNAARVALEQVACMVGAAVAALEVQFADAQREAQDLRDAISDVRQTGEHSSEAIRRCVRERAKARADVAHLHRKLEDAQQEIARWAMDLRAEREQNEASVRRVFAEVRSALGARPDESTEDAARRMARCFGNAVVLGNHYKDLAGALGRQLRRTCNQ